MATNEKQEQIMPKPEIKGCPKCGRKMCDHTGFDLGWTEQRFDAFYYGFPSVKAYREYQMQSQGKTPQQIKDDENKRNNAVLNERAKMAQEKPQHYTAGGRLRR